MVKRLRLPILMAFALHGITKFNFIIFFKDRENRVVKK